MRTIHRPLASLALALALVAAAAGVARAQGGVWSTIPVPGGAVYGVADGDSGTVLIAGTNGAFRFDGFRMRRLPLFSATTDSLKGNCILRTRGGDTWFGTSTGVLELAADGSVHRYDATNGIGNSSDSQVKCLAETPDGTVWAGTSLGGLSRFAGGAWTTLTTDDGLPSMSVSALAVDPNDGTLWAGCLGATGGLAHVVGASITTTNQFTLTASHNVRSVISLPSGRVWFGTDAGLGRFDPSTGALAEFLPGASASAIVALAEGAHGEIWFGTSSHGVGWLDDGRGTLLPSGPPSAVIQHLFADAAGVLWVSTAAGLGRFEGAPVRTLSQTSLLYPNFFAFSALRDRAHDAPGDSVDGHGVVWIGASSTLSGPGTVNLVRRVNGGLRVFGTADGLLPGSAVALAPADSGQVWIGTMSNPNSGLARLSLAGAVLDTVSAALPARDVFALRRAGPGQVWVGGPAGVALVDHGVVRPLASGPAGVPLASVRGLDLDAQGRLWIATGTNFASGAGSGAGAVVFDPRDSSYTVIDASAGLPTNSLTSVAAFANGDVWFGSAVGAIRLRGGVVTTFGVPQGLPSANVPRVVEGPGGEAWIATAGGLVLFDGVNFATFGVSDGLASASLASVFADSLGVIVPSRIDGVSLFRPDATPPRAEIATAPPPATGSRDARFGIRGGDLDSGTRGLLLSYQLDGGPATPFADVAAADFPQLADGDHVFRLWAMDRALNPSAQPEVWAFTVDATPPRPIVQSPAFNDVVHDTALVLGSVADARFLDYTVELRPQGAPTWDTLLVAHAVPAADTLFRWDTRAVLDGVWDLRVGVTDSLGLTGYVQVSVTVDNLAPGASVTSPARVDHVRGGRVYTTFGEVEIDFPPNAFATDQVVRIDSLPPPAGPMPRGGPVGAAWQSGWVVRANQVDLAKPATLVVQTPGVPAGVPVALYRVVVAGTDTSLASVGGARSSDGRSLSTTVSTLGAFAVLAGAGAGAPGATFAGARGLDLQPRVLSPNGGGFDTRLAISFDLGHATTGAVKVFDRAGRLVREIVESGAFAPGRNVVFWDGRDGGGHVVPSGLYMVAVRFDGATKVASVAVANR